MSGSYSLNGQTAGAGTVAVTLAPTASTPAISITVGSLLTVTAGSISVTAQDNGTSTQTELGATGVTATFTAGTGTGVPALTVSNASLGLVSRSTDSVTPPAPTFALLATGDVSLTGAGSTTLTGAGWQVEYDSMGDLSASPVTISTAAGPVVIGFAPPSGQTGTWTQVLGSAALTLGATGALQGSFVVTASASQLRIAATGVSTQLTAGTAALALTNVAGSLTLSGGAGGGAAGSVVGQGLLVGVPGLTLASAPAGLTLTFNTTSSGAQFAVTGTGTVAITGFVSASGSLTISAASGAVDVTITGTTQGTNPTAVSAGAGHRSRRHVCVRRHRRREPAVDLQRNRPERCAEDLRQHRIGLADAPGQTVISGDTFTATGTPTLTVGDQSLTGTFTFTDSAGTVTAVASGVNVSVGSCISGAGDYCVSTTDAGGSFQLTSAGAAASLTAPGITVIIPSLTSATGLTLAGSVQINTQPTPVSLGGTALPAGPYLQVAVSLTTPTAVTLPGTGINGYLQGNFAFQTQTVDNATTVVAGVSGITVTNASSQSLLTNGQGLLVITSGGIAGYVSGYGQLTGQGLSGSGQVLLEINTTNGPIDQTITLGGAQLTVDYSAQQGSLFSVSVSGLQTNITTWSASAAASRSRPPPSAPSPVRGSPGPG